MMEQFPATIHYDAAVDSIKKNEQGQFLVTAGDGMSFDAEQVIIAVGRMGKPNRPEFFGKIPSAIRKHVRFDVRNLDPSGKKILVVGGGNTAIEFALSLCDRGGDISVSYRKEEFTRLNPMNLKLLEEAEEKKSLKIFRQTNVTMVSEDSGRPRVEFKEKGAETFDEIIFGIGGSSPAAFLENAGIKLDERGNPVLNEWLESSVPNLYVVGELSVPQGKGSIIVSFNSGKKVIEGIMKKRQLPRQPEKVSVSF